MVRRLNRLTAAAVNSLTAVGRHADGGNLYLSISPNGGRRWVFLYRWHGKPTEMGLGSVNAISLKQARELASAARSKIALGINPLVEKRRQRTRAPTFGECAMDFIETNRSQWRNEKHIAQWSSTLEIYAEPIWKRPISDLETNDVLQILKPLWRSKQETASRLRGRMERIFAAATARGLRVGPNPAQWKHHLEHQLPKRNKLSRGHHAAMPFIEVPDFMARLRDQAGAAARALEFTILCAARTGETIGARLGEIDIDAHIWMIPRERMKAGREHRVPLSAQALDIVNGRNLEDNDEDGFLFAGLRAGKPLSNMAMSQLLKRMDTRVTVHGFRSSFRDWVAECTSFPNEVAEAALAHTIRNAAEAAYRRGDLLEKRREMMQAWGDFCLKNNRHEAKSIG
jgi:integrase